MFKMTFWSLFSITNVSGLLQNNISSQTAGGIGANRNNFLLENKFILYLFYCHNTKVIGTFPIIIFFDTFDNVLWWMLVKVVSVYFLLCAC